MDYSSPGMERTERVSRGLELVDKRCKMEKGRKSEMGCWVVVEGRWW